MPKKQRKETIRAIHENENARKSLSAALAILNDTPTERNVGGRPRVSKSWLDPDMTRLLADNPDKSGKVIARALVKAGRLEDYKEGKYAKALQRYADRMEAAGLTPSALLDFV